MRLKGSELSPLALSKTAISPNVRTKSGTLQHDSPDFDPELSELTKAWPSLPAEVRAEILRLAGLSAERE